MKGWIWNLCTPERAARWTPASWAPWLVRIGAYLQAIGRECYHQCDHGKQCKIDDKLEQVYGPHET